MTSSSVLVKGSLGTWLKWTSTVPNKVYTVCSLWLSKWKLKCNQKVKNKRNNFRESLLEYLPQNNGHTVHIKVASHERHDISNHRQLDWSFNNLFRPTSKKQTLKLYVILALWGESTDGRWIPIEKGQWWASLWWHHDGPNTKIVSTRFLGFSRRANIFKPWKSVSDPKRNSVIFSVCRVMTIVPRASNRISLIHGSSINTLRPRQSGRHFADDIFKCILGMNMCEFRLRFDCSLFLKFELTIFQHWLR